MIGYVRIGRPLFAAENQNQWNVPIGGYHLGGGWGWVPIEKWGRIDEFQTPLDPIFWKRGKFLDDVKADPSKIVDDLYHGRELPESVQHMKKAVEYKMSKADGDVLSTIWELNLLVGKRQPEGHYNYMRMMAELGLSERPGKWSLLIPHRWWHVFGDAWTRTKVQALNLLPRRKYVDPPWHKKES